MGLSKAIIAAVKAGTKAPTKKKKLDPSSRVLKKIKDEKGFQKKLKKIKDEGVGTPDGFTTQAGKDKALERVYKEFHRPLPKNLSKRLQKANFNSDINKVRRMALTPAARNKKLIEVYKKYGRKAPISLVKPIGKKKGGKVSGHNRLY